MKNLTLLGLPGALRAGSSNRFLVRNAARLMGDGVTYVEADLALPLYDGDLEDGTGIPAPVQTLADQIAAADAVVISTPEYNKNLSGVLKNALDWVSRTEGNPWAGKPVALMSAAGGRSGGERALNSLVLAMMPFRATLVPGPDICVADSNNQFDADGLLINTRVEKSLTTRMQTLRAATGG
ncbi:NAD(P)H-dependent oxidoreductase [Aliiroseovarius subalbicans]|uniref:NADPH-dependent FMN reductase n=1 Tax=Aliiroseovarius subalbicans TaxID=2925840 RepID=UPI001F585734|nr:NAD(P)H-dependent oxidoreductase [Aliiroseovarius subalbicans]MCI2399753.1 NAD(P)H-dependent oxidoreductase [Aliiroseovarius subalbicans]